MTFNSAEEKRQYVNTMFNHIARRYDLMNRIMTLGQDRAWRKLVIKVANLPSTGGRLLDIATGTGDIAFEALQQHPTLNLVVGADFSLPMMTIGQQRASAQQKAGGQLQVNNQFVRWSAADTLNLPFPDNCFDAVVSGFLLRNVVDLRQALAEQVRVCRPGGRIVVLEIPQPAPTLFGTFFKLYFHHVVPVVGGIISGQPEAYKYLPASADAFVRPDTLALKMRQAGLKDVSYQLLMLKTIALHSGKK